MAELTLERKHLDQLQARLDTELKEVSDNAEFKALRQDALSISEDQDDRIYYVYTKWKIGAINTLQAMYLIDEMYCY